MGKGWFEQSADARAVFEKADRLVGNRLHPDRTLSRLCFEGGGGTADDGERLNQTDVSQPAIYACSVACWAGLRSLWGAGGIDEAGIAATAGLSLGEYTALHLAGVFSFEDGLELVMLRGRAMQEAADAVKNADGSPGSGMVALIGADETLAAAVCEQACGSEVLVPANFNAPGQVVISGHTAACRRAVEVAGTMGLRATVLPVAGAFHSPIMQPAADRLRAALAKTPMKPPSPRCPVVSNVTAAMHEPSVERIRTRLVEQLTYPVLWDAGCKALIAGQSGPSPVEFHELAPGRTLAGLMRRIDKNTKVETHEDPPSPLPTTPAR